MWETYVTALCFDTGNMPAVYKSNAQNHIHDCKVSVGTLLSSRPCISVGYSMSGSGLYDFNDQGLHVVMVRVKDAVTHPETPCFKYVLRHLIVEYLHWTATLSKSC